MSGGRYDRIAIQNKLPLTLLFYNLEEQKSEENLLK